MLETLQSAGLRDGTDPTFQLALGHLYLGRMYDAAGRSDLAIAPLQQAVTLFERLAAQDNLAAALGDLANAYTDLGQLDDALRANERALEMYRAMDQQREVAANLARAAQILMAQNRYGAAERSYEEALAAARSAGDGELEGIILQHVGGLHDDQGQYGRAVARYREALTHFQQIGNQVGQMQTCDLLATTEQQRGQLDAAAAWYDRAHALAQQLGDRRQLAIIAQNRGILYQKRAEQLANSFADPAQRTTHLRQAANSVTESLAIRQTLGNPAFTAESYGQLGKIYRLLGEFDKAEENLLQAMQIYESRNLPDVYKVYLFLADIARDRGDAAAAAQWQAKYDAKIAELEARRRTDREAQTSEVSETSEVLTAAVYKLTQAAFQTRAGGAPFPPEAGEALAQLMEQPGPLGQIGLFLSAVAGNQPIPAIPAGLPPQLAQILQSLVEALAE